MGIPDSSLLDLLVKIKSWISWGASDLSASCFFPEFAIMSNSGVKMCCDCHTMFNEFLNGYHCQSCGKWLCANCLRGYESPTAAFDSNEVKGESLKACKFCNWVDVKHDGGKKNGEKVHPLESPRESPEPPSPSIGGDSIQSDRLAHYLESRDCGYSPCGVNNKSMTLFSTHPSPVSVCSTSRSDEDDADNSGNLLYSPLSKFYRDMSDIDSNSISTRLEFYSCKSAGSSPLDSPSRISLTSYRNGHPVQRGQGGSPLFQNAAPFDANNMAVLGRPGKGTRDSENTDEYADDLTTIQNHHEKPQKPLEFENNGLIWFPPPPEDENDEAEGNFFAYDDDDDDIGDSGAIFSSSGNLSSTFLSKDRQDEGNKEPLRAVIQGHFRALVSQLLQGENIRLKNEDGSEVWLDVVTNIAWQAANFVKPDTSKGGSMDPIDYVKVKCIASGRPSDSTLVKGIVCTKNIKHKRMTTQYKNPRLLLLGGALEYQSVVNPLASFQTLVQQENDHLKRIISKIETLRPNVLLVERSVSPYAQQYLLGKDISLVLNVKMPLLQRISRCTGALISPSIDNISTTRLGHCELFRVERVSEEHKTANQFNKKPSKTLMFFEGCPRRLGCTVILKGSNREELKKVKHVVQYAIFAAYHLSLETSFLADEGASLPKITLKHSIAMPERVALENAISVVPSTNSQAVVDTSSQDDGCAGPKPGNPGSELLSVLLDNGGISALSAGSLDYMLETTLFDAYQDDSASNMRLDTGRCKDLKMSTLLHSGVGSVSEPDLRDILYQEKTRLGEAHELAKVEGTDENEVSSAYFSHADTYQSILVSFSSRCVLKGVVCERSRLFRIKFYGSFDKPLGRYLCDDLFNQTSNCRSCNEPAEAHVLCYTHQQGNLTINVRSLSSVKLPGERDGKIWMWHRCLRCAHMDGVPPATRRVVMSDAAWGLSFGKFLELSFSDHATANRVAPCGHSLQRDCLRFYGFGSMVAFFRYSPIDILNVHLPPSMLEFNGHIQQDWIRKEAAELLGKMEAFYEEISDVLDRMEQRSKSSGNEFSDTNELLNHIMELKDQLQEERNCYNGILQPAVMESSQPGQTAVDILELNRLRRALVISSHVWDRQLYTLDSLLKTNSVVKAAPVDASCAQLKELTGSKDNMFDQGHEEKASGYGLKSEMNETSSSSHLVHEGLPLSGRDDREDEVPSDGDSTVNRTFEDFTGNISNLSDRIDSVWTGTYQLAGNTQPLHTSLIDGPQSGSVNVGDNPPLRRLMAPARVHSFDSALRIRKGLLPSSLHLSTLRSFHASGDFRTMLRDPVSSTLRTYSEMLPLEAEKMDLISSAPSLISSAPHLAGGARLLLPQRSQSDIVVGVYDDDPASIVSYALSSKEYEDWIESDGSWTMNEQLKEDSGASTHSAWQSFSSLDLDFIRNGSYGSEDASSSSSTLPMDSKRSPHITISYGDDSPVAGGKVKFSVICYFAKRFDSLRKRCCPSEADFLRSLSRCQRWSAQGGKSNVYFAKSLDERFIIKQVKKTELESFEEFAPEYFKYLMDSLTSGSPTCLAKILGIYQVTVKHLKGGKEVKMDLMVMENLFHGRSIARVYDLKGSARSRYNPDTSGRNKVLLDMNLVEALRTEPIFLGSKAKRSLERAIWNDTAFLASVDVMDYSLLVGVDEERKELVLGIIDFVRQYTWDKHLETWVKAAGILGGPRNASPTIISPKQYKKRFRKAMTSYFLTVPDQWSS